MSDNTKHPSYYGGADNPYEAIKVIQAWGLGFELGNVAKYIARAPHKGNALEDLRKARNYLDFEISKLEKNPPAKDEEETGEVVTDPAELHLIDLHRDGLLFSVSPDLQQVTPYPGSGTASTFRSGHKDRT
jgi:hypothetical protein